MIHFHKNILQTMGKCISFRKNLDKNPKKELDVTGPKLIFKTPKPFVPHLVCKERLSQKKISLMTSILM